MSLISHLDNKNLHTPHKSELPIVCYDKNAIYMHRWHFFIGEINADPENTEVKPIPNKSYETRP